MDAVRLELGRLARATARAVGGARAARLHLFVLIAACALAFVHRAFLRLPGLDALERRWIPTLAVAAVLLLLGPLLTRVLAWFARPREQDLARTLDDRLGWQDATDTATSIGSRGAEGGLEDLVMAQAGGRLRELGAEVLPRRARPWRWPRRLLALLFAALLLLPGVDGWLGARGGGRLGRGAIGSAGPDQPAGAPPPMRADFWLQTFIENPLPVEPLPAAPGDTAGDPAGAARAGSGR